MKRIIKCLIIPLIIYAFFHSTPLGYAKEGKDIRYIISKASIEAKEREKAAVYAFLSYLNAHPQERASFALWITAQYREGCPGSYFCWQGGIAASNPCKIPQFICDRESTDRNWIDIKNPNSSASGKYQIIDGTWEAIWTHPAMGEGKGWIPQRFPHAGLAPEFLQDEGAIRLWNYVDQQCSSQAWSC